ncbi:MAG TPA: glycine cleavage system protein GcvH [Thermomicrobiales bacterium]|nr:glycine cleavage system protein GcvH [Thermomicrobiales bacterium]
MASPADLRYTKTHEWVRRDGDVVTIGITDHAQNELGDITYLELPDVGATVSTNEPFGIVESVKAASDVYAPVEGEVIARNEEAIAAPDLINSSPYDRAWLVKLRVANPEKVEQLMAPGEYDTYAEATGH